MAEIRVAEAPQDDGWTFQVDVVEDGGSTSHEVRVTQADHARFAGDGVPPAQLVEASFRFLLEREPKEAILRRFDLQVIERYFPEYEEEVGLRLGRG